MNSADLQACAVALTDWYAENARPLPWRGSTDPYRVWVSEIMLQQTRIEAVMPYYDRFMRALPDISALAAADEETLLKLWEGLGYYSRVRNLQKAARRVCDAYGGCLPADYDALRELPGIGDYTAGAIASIAFGIPVPAVDGNVMRVLARLCGDTTDVLSGGAKRHFSEIVRTMIPADRPGAFNEGLMELGETVCLPNAVPLCDRCPLREYCSAYRAGTTDELPVRTVKTKRRCERRTVAVVITDEPTPRVLVHRRPESGLLAGLWELPNALAGESPFPESLTLNAVRVDDLPLARHVFSHVEWQMTGTRYRAASKDLPPDYRWITWRELQEEVPLPTAFRAYVDWLKKWMNPGKDGSLWINGRII